MSSGRQHGGSGASAHRASSIARIEHRARVGPTAGVVGEVVGEASGAVAWVGSRVWARPAAQVWAMLTVATSTRTSPLPFDSRCSCSSRSRCSSMAASSMRVRARLKVSPFKTGPLLLGGMVLDGGAGAGAPVGPCSTVEPVGPSKIAGESPPPVVSIGAGGGGERLSKAKLILLEYRGCLENLVQPPSPSEIFNCTFGPVAPHHHAGLAPLRSFEQVLWDCRLRARRPGQIGPDRARSANKCRSAPPVLAAASNGGMRPPPSSCDCEGGVESFCGVRTSESAHENFGVRTGLSCLTTAPAQQGEAGALHIR